MTSASPTSGLLRGARLVDPALERAYREARLHEDARGAMFFTLVVGLAPLLFIVNDLAFLGDGPRFRALAALRAVWAVVSILLAIGQRRAATPRWLAVLTAAATLGSIVLFTFLNTQRPRGFLVHTAVDVMVTNAIWTMLPLPFGLQFVLAVGYTALEGLTIVGWRDTTPTALASIGLAFLLVNTIGAFTCRRLHVSRRREWLALRSEQEGRQALVAAHRAAQEASRAKSAFLASVSHEILTPLNPILGFSELLLARRNDPADQEALQAIAASGRVLHGLLTDVLDLAAGEAAEARLSPAPCDLVALLAEVVRVQDSSAAAKGLRLEVAPTAQPPLLNLDGARLRQVLLNLVANAIRHTVSGGVTVSLSTAPTSTGPLEVVLRVSDTGPGVAPEEREAIFQAFRRGAGEGAGRGQGVGLGLAVSRRLVERMGGTLTLADDAGPGAIFQVRLPAVELAPDPARAAGGAAATPVPGTWKQATVLIVDDEDWNRALLRAYLRGLPVVVDEAASGDAAIAALQQSRPDVVLLDLAMPGTDGLAVLRWARARPELAGVSFVAVTAHARRDQVPEPLDGWIHKPVSRAALLATLARLLPAPAEEAQPLAEPAAGSPASDGGLPPEAVERLFEEAASVGAVPLATSARALAGMASELAVTHGVPGLERWAVELRAGADALDASRVRATVEELGKALEGG